MLPVIYFGGVAALLFLVLRATCGACVAGRSGTAAVESLSVVALGHALSLFLALTYVVCVVFDLIMPEYAMHDVWAGLLPGFVWLTPAGFVIGLIESFLYGWYIALLFGGLFNVFSAKTRSA